MPCSYGNTINPKPALQRHLNSKPPSGTNDFKVQVQVWNDVAWNSVTDYVNVGYCLDNPPGSVNPETCTFTWTPNNTTPNGNYNCGTYCGIFDFTLSLTTGNNYFLIARAYSDADNLTGYSRDQRTGNDARYVYISVKAAKTVQACLQQGTNRLSSVRLSYVKATKPDHRHRLSELADNMP